MVATTFVYCTFKQFNQRFDEEAKARLDGMQGAVFRHAWVLRLRHAAHGLLKQPEKRKLILLVTDGAPADVDERDPQHLRHDGKKSRR